MGNLVPTARSVHVVFALGRCKVAGGPDAELFSGRGAISFGSQKKRQFRIAWLRLSGQSP